MSSRVVEGFTMAEELTLSLAFSLFYIYFFISLIFIISYR